MAGRGKVEREKMIIETCVWFFPFVCVRYNGISRLTYILLQHDRLWIERKKTIPERHEGVKEEKLLI